MHDPKAELVDRMLELHKNKQQAKSDSEKELLVHQIKSTDNEIDNLVFQLYGLTEEEKSIIIENRNQKD